MSADLHALSPLEKVSTPVLNGEFSEQRSRVALIWAHLGDPADQEEGPGRRLFPSGVYPRVARHGVLSRGQPEPPR